MAKKTKSTVANPSEPSVDAVLNPTERLSKAMLSPEVRVLIGQALIEAELEVKQGPGRAGWTYNETERPKIEAIAEFYRALATLI